MQLSIKSALRKPPPPRQPFPRHGLEAFDAAPVRPPIPAGMALLGLDAALTGLIWPLAMLAAFFRSTDAGN